MTGPIPFFPSLYLEVPSFRRPPRPDRASWRYDPVLRSRRYRDHLAGHLVDFLPVVLDLLHPLPREPLLDAADDRVLPAEEVPVRHEAVDQFEVVPRDADRHRVAALADRLDVRLDRLADQGGAVPVRRVLLEEPVARRPRRPATKPPGRKQTRPRPRTRARVSRQPSRSRSAAAPRPLDL